MMRSIHLLVVGAAVVSFAVSDAGAQIPGARPTPDQARALMQARPDLLQQLRQRLAASGMSADQIRSRLRAEGYPADLLDAYLPGSTGTATAPSSELYSAVLELGIADSSDVAAYRAIQGDNMFASPFQQDSLNMLRDARRKRLQREDVADSIARADSGYNIFGLDMFRASPSRFEPNLNGPVDANYRLGPGDRLVLILTGDVESSYVLDVTREGFVVIPQVGQLFVANLTMGDLENLLYSRLGRVYSGVRRGASATTRFSVSVSRLRANQVFVLGDVERPGSYMVSSAGTAITALYTAGGPTANASLRGIQIKRGGTVVSSLDLYDYLLRGDASHDARLETGDIVFVPPRGLRVRIIGEVVRPGTYELKPSETLAELIAAAGGFRADASRRRVQIDRILPPNRRQADGRDRVTVDVESQSLLSGANAAPVSLEAGDVVRVFPVAERVRNTIVVKGNVWSPGPQGLTPGMKISDAIRLAGGPKPDVYLGQVLVDRLRPDQSRVQLRASLGDSVGTVVGDFALQEDDVIQLFALTDFRPERYVAIGGAVRKPGRYPFAEGMTMRDLVLLAGGVQESAYLKEAEIARLPEERTGTTTAVTIRVPLDSTYLFERKPGMPYVGAPGLQASSNGAAEVGLKAYDNVLIMHQPSWELQRVVTISGEVNFPGTYALKTRDERLSDLVARAGGLTSEAYPEGLSFVRKEGGVGRVAIDAPKALRKRSSPENLILMNGDEITVPVRLNVVTVKGAVNAPNVVAYVRGKDMDYYISQGGGVARNGDNKRAYVTQPSGKRETRSRLAPRPPRPLPGSQVIVPELAPGDKTNWVNVLAAVTPLIAVLTSVIITISK
ncbi:MAG TPA: SLBB domain-containing protein [Gemmatimonadaceae bacterium]|nr:SLBB domain-containing protein [Gemmatimonadaceae bacterium]